MDRHFALEMERMRRSEPTRSMQWVEQRAAPTDPAPPDQPPELASEQNYFAEQWSLQKLANGLLCSFSTEALAGTVLSPGLGDQRFVAEAAYDSVATYAEDPAVQQGVKLAKNAPWYELRETHCGMHRARGLRALAKEHLDEVKKLSALAGGRDAFAKTHHAADFEDVVLQLAYMLHARDVVRMAKVAATHHAAQHEMEALHAAKAAAKAALDAAEAALLNAELARLRQEADAQKPARAKAAYRKAYAAKLIELEPERAAMLQAAGSELTATTPSANAAHETAARLAGKAASDAVLAQPVAVFGAAAADPFAAEELRALWLANAAGSAQLRWLRARLAAAEAAHNDAHERQKALDRYAGTKQVGLLGRTLQPNLADEGHLRTVIDNATAAASANGLGFGTNGAAAPGDVEALEAYGAYRQWKQSHLYHACLTDEEHMHDAYGRLQRRGFERQRELAQRAQGMPVSPLPAEWTAALQAGALPDVPLPMEPPLLPARISAPPRMGKSALILQMASFAVKLPDGFATIGIAPNKTLPMQEWFAKIDALGWDHPLLDLAPPLAAGATDAQRSAYEDALARYRAQHTGGLVTGYMSNGFLYRRTAHLPHHDEAAYKRMHRWRCVDETPEQFDRRRSEARDRWMAANPQSLPTDFEGTPEWLALVRETRERWMPALGEAFRGPAAVRMVLYSVSEMTDVRGINGVLDALQERPESFVLKVYDESQFLSRQDFPDQQNVAPREPFRLQAELRRTAPIMLGLPLMVSATQLAARFERVFYGPVLADTDMPVADVPDVATTAWPQTQFRYQMVPLVDEHDLERARAIAPILPPSLRPRAFASDDPNTGELLAPTYYGSTAKAPCGHVRPWTPPILTPWWPAGATAPEPASTDQASLAFRLYGGPANPQLRAALSMRPGMLNESGNNYREKCREYPVLNPLQHGPKVQNLEASMRLVVRHFVAFLNEPPHVLDANAKSYAIPMHVLATCRDVFGPLGMLHQVRLLSLYALWNRAQHEKPKSLAIEKTRRDGIRQHYLRRKWGVAFVVVADCRSTAANGKATATAMTGGRPGTSITTWSNFLQDVDKVDNLTTRFYRESASTTPPSVLGSDPLNHRYDPAAKRFVDACRPEAGNLAAKADEVEVTLFLLDPALPRNSPRPGDVRGGTNAGGWHGHYPLFGLQRPGADSDGKQAMHPHFARHDAIKKRLRGVRTQAETKRKQYVSSLARVWQLFGTAAGALSPTAAASALSGPGAKANYPAPDMLAEQLELSDFEQAASSGATKLSAAGVAKLQGYYAASVDDLQNLFAASTGPGQPKVGTVVRKKLEAHLKARAEREAAERAFAADPANAKPADGATHSTVYDGAGHQTDDFPDLSHLFDAWPNPEQLSNRDEHGAVRAHYADAPWSQAAVELLESKKFSYSWQRDGAVRGDVRAFGCKSVAGAIRLAAALDIHRVCAVGYAKMASALTLQSTLANQPFELHPGDKASAALDKNTTLCYVPKFMALASSEESGLDEMYQILGRTFVDMKTRKLPDDWKVELLTARLDDKTTRGWPGTLEDCLRATAPNPGDALPTLLDSLRQLAYLEHLFAEQPAINIAEMVSTAFGPAVLEPGTRTREQNRLGERAAKFFGFTLSGPTVLRPTVRSVASLLRTFQLVPKELDPTTNSSPTDEQKLERDRTAGMLMRRVGHRQSMGRTGRYGPSALWRLFYSHYNEFHSLMDLVESVAGSSGAGSSVAGSSVAGAP